MTRYLVPAFIKSAIHRGVSVEQFLGGFDADGEPALRYMELRPKEDRVELWVHEVYDQGDESYLDLYDFTPLDDDAEDEPATQALTLDEALALARDRFGAHPDRWVHEGVIQDEYLDYLRSR
ncbi:MAG TPA: hypothetical protein VK358_00300 [Longimicrobium sp.]|nr:hypothetical protein [Longimicrobium sp.]